jgi:hypothetical protein
MMITILVQRNKIVILAYLIETFATVYRTGIVIPCSQVPVTEICPVLFEFTPYPIYLLSILILSLHIHCPFIIGVPFPFDGGTLLSSVYRQLRGERDEDSVTLD